VKKIFVFIVTVILSLPLFAAGDKQEDKPTVYLFYSSHCGACAKLGEEYMPRLEKKYGDKIIIDKQNIAEARAMSMLLRLCDLYKKAKPVTPSALIGNNFLTGASNIKDNLEKHLDDILAGRQANANIVSSWKDLAYLNTLMTFFKKVTIATVLLTGLVDGVNPCAFAVIAFFVSFLAVYGYRRREILIVGAAYCSAVFLTYILLGMGMFEVLYRVSGFIVLRKAFYYVVAALCFILFALALYDYLKFRKTGTGDGMVLQLPKFLKKNIHIMIGNNLRDKKGSGVWGLLVTSFVVGMGVALLEGACTGQLYLPAIAMISQSTQVKYQAWGYLLAYNLMFILPLVFVFGCSLWGVNSRVFSDFLKCHLGRIKAAMAVIFFVMGLIMFFLA